MTAEATPTQVAAAFRPLLPPGAILRVAEICAPRARRDATTARRARAAERDLGRALARDALGELGMPLTEVQAGPDRAPRWPDGTCGSITHAHGLCAVTIAPARAARSIGIDLEWAAAVGPETEEIIATPAERIALEGRDPAARQARRAALFSAKEAVYKCQYPLTGQMIGFEDVTLETLEEGRFLARVRPGYGAAPLSIAGRFAFCGGFVLAVASLPASTRQRAETRKWPQSEFTCSP